MDALFQEVLSAVRYYLRAERPAASEEELENEAVIRSKDLIQEHARVSVYPAWGGECRPELSIYLPAGWPGLIKGVCASNCEA